MIFRREPIHKKLAREGRLTDEHYVRARRLDGSVREVEADPL